MLVLTRKLNETIIIDGNITVTVVEVRGNRVKLGISAPVDVPVMREEIALALRERSQPMHTAANRAVAVSS
ncbi:MAG: carbon storage regulator CsrA [Planctomycetaceae bacterium]